MITGWTILIIHNSMTSPSMVHKLRHESPMIGASFFNEVLGSSI